MQPFQYSIRFCKIVLLRTITLRQQNCLTVTEPEVDEVGTVIQLHEAKCASIVFAQTIVIETRVFRRFYYQKSNS